MLWWKLVVTPLIIGVVTLVGRRWGPRVAGLLVGLPLTSAPVSVFLATERGTAFAAGAAVGAIVGFFTSCCCIAAYALVARRREWPVALLAGLTVLTGLAFLLNDIPFSLGSAFATSATGIVVLWAVVIRPVETVGEVDTKEEAPAAAPAWDVPARMLMVTAMVAGLTAAATVLGPRASGVLSAFPILGGVLSVFTHRHDGPRAANTVIRAMIIGSIPGILFFAVVGVLAAPGRLAVTYAAAAVVALGSGAIVSHLTRPRLSDRLALAAQPTRRAA